MKRLCATLLILVAGIIMAPPVLAQAVETEDIQTEIIIPGQRTTDEAIGSAVEGRVSDLAEYVSLIYNFMISVVGVLAAVMMMVGGFQYLTAGGDKAKVDAGKKRVVNALAGMVLAFSSYIILHTINPDLVNLKIPTIGTVKTETASFIVWCEDIVTRGVNVAPVVSGQTDCGRIGSYEGGQYCVYYGAPIGTLRAGATGQALCMQANLSAAEFQKTVETSLSVGREPVRQARQVSCASLSDWGSTRSAADLKYPSVNDSVCRKWWETSRRALGSGGTPVYCGYDPEIRGCYQAAIICPRINNDCDNYEDEVDALGYDRGKFGIINELEDMSPKGKGLTEVCAWNPCNVNAPKGCKAATTVAVECDAIK